MKKHVRLQTSFQRVVVVDQIKILTTDRDRHSPYPDLEGAESAVVQCMFVLINAELVERTLCFARPLSSDHHGSRIFGGV